MQSPSKGKVIFTDDSDSPVAANKIFNKIAFSAPGQEIVEELTMREFLNFHFSFKQPLNDLRIDDIIALTGLQAAADKPIGDYSSGMKQRVKLAQAIFSDTPILMLDEPCTNLDQAGVEQYRDWIETYAANRLILVASNDVREYFFCNEKITLENFK
jgi:ABC-type multidrug transport system ATPase subunit